MVDGAHSPVRSAQVPVDARLLDALVELSPDPALVVDARGVVRGVNQLARELFGYAQKDLLGCSVEDLLPERFRAAHAAYRAGFEAVPQARRMGAGLDLWGRRRDGSEFPVDVSLAPVTGPNGPLVVAGIRDMTERRRQRQAEALLAAIVTSSTDAIVSLTPDGVVTSWNTGAERLLGYPAEQIVGQSGLQLAPKDVRGELAAMLSRAAKGRSVAPFETRLWRRDGSEVDVEVTLSPIRDAAERPTGVAGVLRDITDRLTARAERARAQHEHELLVMAEDRERIARDLHDLVIQRVFAAGLALEATAPRISDPAPRQRVQTVIEDLDESIREIRSTIFALAHHTGTGATGLRTRILDLVRDVERAAGHTPTVQFDGAIDARVPDATAAHLIAVLREALSNVAKHAKATSTQVEVTVDDSRLVLRVLDNGIGLPPVNRESGLRNLRDRAERLGGSLHVARRPERGTGLTWQVPLTGE